MKGQGEPLGNFLVRHVFLDKLENLNLALAELLVDLKVLQRPGVVPLGKVDLAAQNRVYCGEKLGLGLGNVAGGPKLYRGLYAERLLQNGVYRNERFCQPVPVAVVFQKGKKV